ncbi:MAG: hypothetical protein WCI63_00770 [bacterium]
MKRMTKVIKKEVDGTVFGYLLCLGSIVALVILTLILIGVAPS